ncbi:MAG: hypothetical protein JSS02_31575 [Planctomycetes bacterium]|nr:hypothetical protein [Planctomycetota bacterium]
MSSSGSGPLGLLLMIAPLAAIPVFAIVGVPQFASVSASQNDDDLDWNEPAAPASAGAVSNDSATSSGRAPKLFSAGPDSSLVDEASAEPRRPNRSGAKSHAPPSAPPRRWLPPPDALDQWETGPEITNKSNGRTARDGSHHQTETIPEEDFEPEPPENGQVSADGFDPDLLLHDAPRATGRKPKVQVTEDAPAPTKRKRRAAAGRSEQHALAVGEAVDTQQLMKDDFNWRAAVARLKNLGIRKYRLESQLDTQTFVFICNYSPPENPRVVRRFEGEADTPLEAVHQVLQQLDDWRSRNSTGHDTELLADDDHQ